LVVEVDGDTHDPVTDQLRDQRLAEQGFAVVRISNLDVTGNLEGVLEVLLLKLRALLDRFTHPYPSLEREGD
jgi:very-short-patch-repair endonuclease